MTPPDKDSPTAGVAAPALRRGAALRLLAGMALAAALTPLNSTMIAVALPEIGEAFDASAAALTLWLVTFYLIVALVCQSPAGRLGDSLGRRWSMSVGRWMFVASAAIAIVAPTLAALTVARVLMAAAGALMVPTAMVVLRNSIAPERRARAFGMVTAVMAGAAAVGPAIGGVLTDLFGWHSVFLVNLPLVAISWALQAGLNVDALGGGGRPGALKNFDWAGSLLLGLALAAAVLGMRETGSGAVSLLAFAVVVLAAFLYWERRHPAPVIDLELFLRPRFAAGAAIIGLQNLSLYATLFTLPFLLTLFGSEGRSSVGAAMVSLPLSSVLLAPLGGLLAERIGTRVTAMIGLGTAAVGVALMAGVGELESLVAAAWRLFLVGGGIGLAIGPTQAGALGAVHRHESGMAAAALSTVRYFGGAVGIAILSVLLAATPDSAGLDDYRFNLVVFTVPLIIAALAAVALPRKGEHGLL